MVRRIPRWLARAPIPLLRTGFGRLLGRRVAMLEHRGRVSGLPRYVVLEVIGRRPDGVDVVSGYGVRSQWYRNVLARPEVRLWCGRSVGVPARATPLPADRPRTVLADYRDRHRRAARALGRTLDLADLVHAGPLPTDIADRLPVVRITTEPEVAAPGSPGPG
ncbi:nitroreductase family deazaflavin-dependent oxidoreductase [Micromonospora zhanjiangensis]